MTREITKSGKLAAVMAAGLLAFGAALWLTMPRASAEELVQLALLDLEKFEPLSVEELAQARGTGGDDPTLDATISDQFAVILWDETKRQKTPSGSGGNVTVTVTVVE